MALRSLVPSFFAAAVAAVAAHDRVVERRDGFPKDADVLYVAPAEHLAPMSLGYREALADLLWVRATIFFGERIGQTEARALQRYCDAVVGLSPRFHRAYAWCGVALVYSAPVITRSMVDGAVAIYRKGLIEHPESHEVLYALGMLLLHQISSTPGYSDAERDDSKREGIELIRKAAAFGADPLVRSYAATLVSDHASADQLAIQFLESQLAQTDDPEYRRLLRKKLAELGDTSVPERTERIREDFRAEHEKRMWYAPDWVYAVIRAEKGTLDEARQLR